MIIQVDSLGSQTRNYCRIQVPIPVGAQGVKLVSINIPYNAGVYSDEFVDGVVVAAETFTVPAFGSFVDFRRWFNLLRTAGGARVFYAYGTNEFDLCVAANAVTLSAGLATYLGLDTALAANTCFTTTFDIIQADPVYDYIVKFVAPITAKDNVLGLVHSTKGDAYSNEFHTFNNCCEIGEIEIYCRLKDGSNIFATVEDDERWGVELEF